MWRPALPVGSANGPGPDAPKLGMSGCLRRLVLRLSALRLPQRTEAPYRGERRLATWGLLRASGCWSGGLRGCAIGGLLRAAQSASSGWSLPAFYSIECRLTSIAPYPSLKASNRAILVTFVMALVRKASYT